ncbi:putative protein N(5)-glutamine methyltransferase [Specibacter sp. RAF43]|uniref:putative protein N(5)-glutamine methyltransferase n=1 Tax=Specibacter sp. RAF43 TaxID=3233057 RepID=UPI003F980649
MDSSSRPNGPPPGDRSAVVARLSAAGCVYAEDEAAVLLDAAHSPSELEDMLQRRVAGFPLEHIVGWAEFRGLRITVAPGVFVPRRRTEFLVDQALVVLRRPAGRGPGVVLDVCCGSGAVGAALAAAEAPLEVHAADIDPVAAACAVRNLAAAGGRAYCGDLFDPLPRELRGRLTMIVANAPYVPTAAIAFMPPEARLHESTAALDGGADGMDLQRRIAQAAPYWLAPGGHLLLETSARQAPAGRRLLARHGFRAEVAHSEALDATVVAGELGGRRAAAPPEGHPSSDTVWG